MLKNEKTTSSGVKHKLYLMRSLLVVLCCSMGLLLGSCGSSTGPGGNGGGGNGGNGDDNGDNGGNNNPPEATFSNVQVVLNNNCGGSACHIGGRTNGVRLDSYDNVMNSVGTNYGTEIVVAGDPDNSPIIDKISNDNPEYGSRMPEGRAPLSNENITLIRDWIANGAENN